MRLGWLGLAAALMCSSAVAQQDIGGRWVSRSGAFSIDFGTYGWPSPSFIEADRQERRVTEFYYSRPDLPAGRGCLVDDKIDFVLRVMNQNLANDLVNIWQQELVLFYGFDPISTYRFVWDGEIVGIKQSVVGVLDDDVGSAYIVSFMVAWPEEGGGRVVSVLCSAPASSAVFREQLDLLVDSILLDPGREGVFLEPESRTNRD